MCAPETDHAHTQPAKGGESALFRTYAVPFIVFLGFNLLLWVVEGSVKWDHPSAAWWQRMPELPVYALQVLVCAAYLWHVRRRVEWACRAGSCVWGALAGVLGIALWLVPYVAGWVPQEGGFCPEAVFGAGSAGTCAAYALRFARAVLIVPLIEEFFWRGYLMRWCINREEPQRVPLGKGSWLSYPVVTLAFMLVHNPADYAGAFLYGSLAYLVVMRTRQLVPVILMHAVANLVMGVCAIKLNLPNLW